MKMTFKSPGTLFLSFLLLLLFSAFDSGQVCKSHDLGSCSHKLTKPAESVLSGQTAAPETILASQMRLETSAGASTKVRNCAQLWSQRARMGGGVLLTLSNQQFKQGQYRQKPPPNIRLINCSLLI